MYYFNKQNELKKKESLIGNVEIKKTEKKLTFTCKLSNKIVEI